MALGQQVFEARSGVQGVVGALGRVMIGFGNLARNPSKFPIRALVAQMEQVGVSSLPIIGLMSFLIGIVIAQQGAVQLEQFGAETLTVNLVGRISLRELGVLMTAIMVAGRSGSAFAAQLGTMKLTEEIDAMRTIGIAPTEVLIIPRIVACTFMMLLLGFYASVVAIIGGAVIGQFAPVLKRGLILPERQRQKLARLHQAFKPLDRAISTSECRLSPICNQRVESISCIFSTSE